MGEVLFLNRKVLLTQMHHLNIADQHWDFESSILDKYVLGGLGSCVYRARGFSLGVSMLLNSRVSHPLGSKRIFWKLYATLIGSRNKLMVGTHGNPSIPTMEKQP